MKQVYEVVLHETNGCTIPVCRLIVRAKSVLKACQKAIAYAKRKGYTPCRVSSCIESRHVDDVVR